MLLPVVVLPPADFSQLSCDAAVVCVAPPIIIKPNLIGWPAVQSANRLLPHFHIGDDAPEQERNKNNHMWLQFKTRNQTIIYCNFLRKKKELKLFSVTLFHHFLLRFTFLNNLISVFKVCICIFDIVFNGHQNYILNTNSFVFSLPMMYTCQSSTVGGTWGRNVLMCSMI